MRFIKTLIIEFIRLILCIIACFLFILVFWVVAIDAQETVIWRTYPGHNVVDLRKPAIVVKQDGSVYRTYPGTSVPDLRKPGYKIQNYNKNEWLEPHQSIVPYLFNDNAFPEHSIK